MRPTYEHQVAVAVGQKVLLIGGSNASGYAPMGQLAVFDTGLLSWSSIQCAGKVPTNRSGHAGASLRLQSGDWSVYIFGGGNSATGFADLHQLDTSTWRWTQLDTLPAASGSQVRPTATEGAAIAVSGGMLLVCGGYTATGATRSCYAWGCNMFGAARADAHLLR